MKFTQMSESRIQILVSNFRFRIVEFIAQFFRCNTYKFFIRPLFLGLPSITIACYKIEPLQRKVPPKIINFLNEHVIWIVGLYFIIPLWIGVEDYVKELSKKIAPQLSNEGYLLFLKALDFPVDKKLNRFLKYLAGLPKTKHHITSGQIFKNITQPDTQLAEIIRSIHIFFEGLAKILKIKDLEISTVLLKIENNMPSEAWCYFPESEPPNPKILTDKRSLACQTLKTRKRKKILIVNDIKKEKMKNNPKISTYCSLENGSALCYIIESNHITTPPLALRIVANKPLFDERKRQLYLKIFERFEKRILIEYALSEMKKNAKR